MHRYRFLATVPRMRLVFMILALTFALVPACGVPRAAAMSASEACVAPQDARPSKGSGSDPQASPAPQGEVALLLRAGALIDALESESAKSALRRRLDTAMSRADAAERLAELTAIVGELEQLRPAAKGDAAGANRLDLEREAEALNLVTVYLYLLRDLDGSGFLFVKRELTDNVKLSGVTEETRRLYRRLLEACNEAESTLRDMRYINEDWAKSIGNEFGQALGAGGVVAIFLGDPTPLLGGLVSATEKSMRTNDEANRALDTVRARFEDRISSIAFEANTRRGDFLSNESVDRRLFLTQSTYEDFRNALAASDASRQRVLLEKVIRECPGFREAYVYLAACRAHEGNHKEACRVLQPVARRASRILQREGVRVRMFHDLAAYALELRNAEAAEQYANEALALDPSFGSTLMLRAQARAMLSRCTEALEDISASLKAEDTDGSRWWSAARILARCDPNEGIVLGCVEQATLLGHGDFDTKGAPELARALGADRGRWLTTPRIYARYSAGILNDDIVLVNQSSFPVTGLSGTGRVDYLKDGTERTAVFSFMERTLMPGGTIVLTDLISMPVESWCRVQIEFTCDQSRTKAVSSSGYNLDGMKLNRPLYQYQNAWGWQVYLNDDRAALADALANSEASCKATWNQEPLYLDTLAHLHCMNGAMDRAVAIQEKAIEVAERTKEPKIRELRVALARFKAGRCR